MTTQIEKTRKTSYVVFGIALFVVTANLLSIWFPTLYASLLGLTLIDVDPFEPGAYMVPFLVANFVILGFAVMYYKNSPKTIRKLVEFFLNFDVPKKVALIVIAVLLAIYVSYTVLDLTLDESEEWKDYIRIQHVLEDWPESQNSEPTTKIRVVKNVLLFFSQNYLQNIKIVPYLASIALLLVTYFLTEKISNRRFSGLVAMAIILQSPTFHRYDSLATYDNFWTLFYLLSLYTVYKKWYTSPISFILSVFSKPVTLTFLPMTLFFVHESDISRRRKILITICYASIIALSAGLLASGVRLGGSNLTAQMDVVGFWYTFTSFTAQLRLDWLFLIFLLPLIVALFLRARKGFRHADSLLVLIMGTIVSEAFLSAFTGYNVHPYRFIPSIVFFAIGVGVLFSKRLPARTEASYHS